MDKYNFSMQTCCCIDDEEWFGIPCLFHGERSALVFSRKYRTILLTWYDGVDFPEDEDLWPRRVYQDKKDPTWFKAPFDDDKDHTCVWVPELGGKLIFHGDLQDGISRSEKSWKERAEHAVYWKDYELFGSTLELSVKRGQLYFTCEGKELIVMDAQTYEMTKCVSERFKRVWNTNKDIDQVWGRHMYIKVCTTMMPEDMIQGYIDFDDEGTMWFALFTPNESWGEDAVEWGYWQTEFYKADAFLKHHPAEFEKMMATYDEYLVKSAPMHKALVNANAYKRGEFVEES